jgi:hypothetical protein
VLGADGVALCAVDERRVARSAKSAVPERVLAVSVADVGHSVGHDAHIGVMISRPSGVVVAIVTTEVPVEVLSDYHGAPSD